MTQHGTSNPESKPIEDTDGVSIERLSYEHLQEALGIGTATPRLSWTIKTSARAWSQSAYALEAYTPGGNLRSQVGPIESDQSVLVSWPFEPLSSRERLNVRVRVWGMDGQPSHWSQLAPVEAGLLHPADWSARFITPGLDEDLTQSQPCPMVRREFTLRNPIQQARLYITSLGVYEAQINGAVVGDQVLSPGWTSYSHRLRYQTFDVTASLKPGLNAIGAILGDGWFRGRLGYGGGRRNVYGNRLALLAQLEVVYQDGSVDWIVSDENWRATTGPILASDLYDGETYDARLELPGWSSPGFGDRGWRRVWELDRDLATLIAPSGPPVRRTEILAPVEIQRSPSGRTIIDFGQNLVGRPRISVQGKAGQTITLRHAEVLEGGELCLRPLRQAKARDTYILKGGGLETWEPRFTFHGFRYVEVEGWPGEIQPELISAIVCHSDMERTGWFECSDPLLNRLHENIVWSMRGNFLDIPTDCPQRDERLGWTGDIQVFSPTAAFLYDCAGFLTSWLADLAAEQAASGSVPFFVPTVVEEPHPPAAAWGDAAVIVPWVLYQRFGDTGILARQFASMRSWIDQIASVTGGERLWDKGMQFGDWLDPAAPPEKPGAARTPAFIVATAYFTHSAEIVGKAAGVLGKTVEEEHYLGLAREIRNAFNSEYVTATGRVIGDSPTAYALALEFALLPEASQRQHAGKRLAELVRAGRYHISTGFVGTPLICDALCRAGEFDAAYRLILQNECPSWLYPVTMGATTIWERWDSLLPDGSVNPGEMTSFNHYALGAVADWLHRTVGGLAPAPAGPGYCHIEIQPKPGGSLNQARTRHRTPYGMAECHWKIEAGTMTVEVEIPPNTTASITLPGSDQGIIEVGSGKYQWSYRYDLPKTNHQALSLDSTFDDLIDVPEAHLLVMNILSQYNSELAGRMDGQDGMTLRNAVSLMPHSEEITVALSHALASLEREIDR